MPAAEEIEPGVYRIPLSAFTVPVESKDGHDEFEFEDFSESEHEDEDDSEDNDSSESDEDEGEPLVIPVSRADIDACSIVDWHARLKRYTPATRIIPLKQDFISYLLQDGVSLPDALAPRRQVRELSSDDSDSDDEPRIEELDTDSELDAADDFDEASFFPDLVQSINQAIDQLGGTAMPRLDWSIPRDAAWISADKSLKCFNAGEVFLLLKSSDSVAADIHSPYLRCSSNQTTASATDSSSASSSSNQASSSDTVVEPRPYHLVLQRWSNLHPSSEWRCFVHNKQLLCFSQKDSTYYSHLAAPQHRRAMRHRLTDFVECVVASKINCDNFVCDVYVDNDKRAWLMDVKPWSIDTNTRLYSWKSIYRLLEKKNTDPDMSVKDRVVSSLNDSRQRDMVDIAKRSVQRMPHIEGIDLSDQAAIERFIRSVDVLNPKP